MVLKVLTPLLSVLLGRQNPGKLPEILNLLMLDQVGTGGVEVMFSAEETRSKKKEDLHPNLWRHISFKTTAVHREGLLSPVSGTCLSVSCFILCRPYCSCK